MNIITIIYKQGRNKEYIVKELKNIVVTICYNSSAICTPRGRRTSISSFNAQGCLLDDDDEEDDSDDSIVFFGTNGGNFLPSTKDSIIMYASLGA